MNSDIPVIHMEGADSIRLSDYFSEVRYTHFDSSPEAIFGEAKKMILSKDRIFILDDILKSAIGFDTTGRFLFRIQKVGKGPGEYRNLDAMWVEPDLNQLWLHCRIPEKTIVYTYDGEFVREFSGDRGAEDRQGLPGQGFISHALYPFGMGTDTTPSGVFLSDTKGVFKRNIINIGKYTPYWCLLQNTYFSRGNDSIYLLSQSDSIFRFSSTGIANVDFCINWGKYHLPLHYRDISFDSPRIKDYSSCDAFFWKDHLLVSGPLRWFSCGKLNQGYFAIVDKRSLKGVYSQQLYNDLGVLPVAFPFGQGDNGELLSLLQMDLIYAMMESLEASQVSDEFKDQYQAIQVFLEESIRIDRPVLVRMKLKKEF